MGSFGRLFNNRLRDLKGLKIGVIDRLLSIKSKPKKVNQLVSSVRRINNTHKPINNTSISISRTIFLSSS